MILHKQRSKPPIALFISQIAQYFFNFKLTAKDIVEFNIIIIIASEITKMKNNTLHHGHHWNIQPSGRL